MRPDLWLRDLVVAGGKLADIEMRRGSSGVTPPIRRGSIRDPNGPRGCGSGKKRKRCCGRRDRR